MFMISSNSHHPFGQLIYFVFDLTWFGIIFNLLYTDGEIKGILIVRYEIWNNSASVMNYEQTQIQLQQFNDM